MKNGNSSASNASNSLAIAERPKQAPSCAAALFQLFAKRKLFSSSSKKNKLLPPVRTPKKSPRWLGGGDKLPVAKMRPLLIEGNDPGRYPRGKSEGNADGSPPSRRVDTGSEMCAPGVVARLMGLSSVPAVGHQRPSKATDSPDLGDHRNEHSRDFSDVHRRKPGQLTDGRHANASQFSPEAHPSWSRRHTHKLASPVKSPRSISGRNKARLIEAAAKVLEPGLQSRSRRLARPHGRLEYLCDNGSASGNAILLNMSDELSRDLGDAAALRSCARSVGPAYVQNSSSSHEWSGESGKMKASARRPNTIARVQLEGNGKDSPVSSSEKGRPTSLVFRDKNNVQRSAGGITEPKQDIRKIQHRNMCRENVVSSPLKQNNLKQNAMPVACRAAVSGYMVQRQKHRIGEQNVTNLAKDFVSLNKDLNSSTSLRSKKKPLDRADMTRVSLENKNTSTKGQRTYNLRSDSINSVQLKTATPKAMEKDMIIAKGAGLVSEKPKSTSPNRARRDLRKQVDLHNVARGNNSDIVSFTFSSPMKTVLPTSLISNDISEMGGATTGSPGDASCPKTRSNKECQTSSSQREFAFRENLPSTSELKTREPVSINLDFSEKRYYHSRSLSSSMFEKMSPVVLGEKFHQTGNELPWKSNFMDHLIYGFEDLSKSMEFHNTREKLEGNAKASNPAASAARDTDHQSPVSILQASVIHDECLSGSSHRTADMEFKESCYFGFSTSPISMWSSNTEKNSCTRPNCSEHRIPPFASAVQDSKLRHLGQVASTVELLLTDIFLSKTKASFKTFLHETFESALTALSTSAKCSFNVIEAKDANPLRTLAFDFLMECLDSMCSQFWDSGYKSWSKLALLCTKERLVAQVKNQVVRCSNMAGKTLDDVVGDDVEHSNGMNMDSLHEAFQIGVQIEADLLQELVNEIELDMLKC